MMNITSVLTVFLLFTSCASETPQNASTVALQKIYDNAGGRGDVSSITFADLVATGVTGLIEENMSKYLNAIARKTDFSVPARVEEVQEMMLDVNNFSFIGKWSLLHVNTGFSQPGNYNFGEIIWDIKENIIDVKISINLDDIDERRVAYFTNGEYTYSLNPSNEAIIYFNDSSKISYYYSFDEQGFSMSTEAVSSDGCCSLTFSKLIE